MTNYDYLLKRFGSENARVGGPDLKLTRNNDDTIEIMLKARDGKFEGGAEFNMPDKTSVGILTHSLTLLTIILTLFNDRMFTVQKIPLQRARPIQEAIDCWHEAN